MAEKGIRVNIGRPVTVANLEDALQRAAKYGVKWKISQPMRFLDEDPYYNLKYMGCDYNVSRGGRRIELRSILPKATVRIYHPSSLAEVTEFYIERRFGAREDQIRSYLNIVNNIIGIQEDQAEISKRNEERARLAFS